MRILQGVDRPDEGTVDRRRRAGAAFRSGRRLRARHRHGAPGIHAGAAAHAAREPHSRAASRSSARRHRSIARRARRRRVALAAIGGRQARLAICATADAPMHVRQILEILRLLYRGADVLILDEPTAVLAPAQIASCSPLMRKLKAEGRTILFISHKLDEVLAVADAITVMRAGRVVANTTRRRDQRAGARASSWSATTSTWPRTATRAASPASAVVSRSRGLVGARSARHRAARPASTSTSAPARSSASPASAATVRTSSSPALAGLARADRRRRSASPARDLTRPRPRASGAARARLCQRRPRRRGPLPRPPPIRRQFHRRASPRGRPLRAAGFSAPRNIRGHVGDALAALLACATAACRDPAASLSGGNQQRLADRARTRLRSRISSSPRSRRAASTSAGTAFIHQLIARLPRPRRRGPAGLRRARRDPRAVGSHRRPLQRPDRRRARRPKRDASKRSAV